MRAADHIQTDDTAAVCPVARGLLFSADYAGLPPGQSREWAIRPRPWHPIRANAARRTDLIRRGHRCKRLSRGRPLGTEPTVPSLELRRTPFVNYGLVVTRGLQR